MIYKFTSGSGFSGDAESTYFELESIREQNNGKLQTQDIVEAARHHASALHPHFEWDDYKAAEKYRQNTARQLVRAIIVQPDSSKQQNETYRPYISVTAREGEEKARYYQNIEVASQDEFESALEHFHSKLKQLQAAVQQIEMYAKNEDQRLFASQLKEHSRQMESIAYAGL